MNIVKPMTAFDLWLMRVSMAVRGSKIATTDFTLPDAEYDRLYEAGYTPEEVAAIVKG